MTSQDFVKRIDLTGLEDVTGSEMNQLIDTAKTAEDKGLILVTTDTAFDVPDVPEPDQELEGVSVEHWKRYIWLRKPFSIGSYNKAYAWNDLAESHATLLKWELLIDKVELDADILQLQTDVATALQNSINAVNVAEDASTLAQEANVTATTAEQKAQTALTNSETNTEAIADLTERVVALEEGDSGEDIVPVSAGGTGATTVQNALINLGLRRVPLGSWFIYDVKAQNTGGGSFPAGVWTSREFNTKTFTNQNIEAFLGWDTVAKTLTLFAGVWEVEIEAPAVTSGLHKIRLISSDEQVIHAYGSNAFGSADAQCITWSKIRCYISLAALSVMKVQHICSGGNLINGLGIATNLGPEIYTTMKFTYLGNNI